MSHSPAPSQTLMQCLDLMRLPSRALILDAPSGAGRNAIALSRLGYDVIAIDNDFERLQALGNSRFNASSAVHSVIADLDNKPLPFASCSFSAIVCVHFSIQVAIKEFDRVLKKDGALYVETFGGQGQNFLQLPKAGEIRDSLLGYSLDMYTEKRAGPPNQTAVSLRLVAHKSRM